MNHVLKCTPRKERKPVIFAHQLVGPRDYRKDSKNIGLGKFDLEKFSKKIFMEDFPIENPVFIEPRIFKIEECNAIKANKYSTMAFNIDNELISFFNISEMAEIHAQKDDGMFHYGLILRNTWFINTNQMYPSLEMPLQKSYEYWLIHALHTTRDLDRPKLDFMFCENINDAKRRVAAVLGLNEDDAVLGEWQKVSRYATASVCTEAFYKVLKNQFMFDYFQEGKNSMCGSLALGNYDGKTNCVLACKYLKAILLNIDPKREIENFIFWRRKTFLKKAKIDDIDEIADGIPCDNELNMLFWETIEEKSTLSSKYRLQKHKLQDDTTPIWIKGLSKVVREIGSWSIHCKTYRIIKYDNNSKLWKDIARDDDLKILQKNFNDIN